MSLCARSLNKMEIDQVRWSSLFSLIIVFALFAASCAPSSAVPEQITPSPEITKENDTPTVAPTLEAPTESKIPRAEIEARLAKLVDFVPLAGIALGIQFKGETYQQGFGLADIQNRKPATAQTVFKIASLTKSFTAAAILRLSEEGKLGLEDPISRFLPGTPDLARNIQIQHLLNHTSGLPDLSMDTAQEALPESFTTAQAVEYYFSTVQNLEFEPGEASSYSNAGYFLLGAIIENVSGMTYDEYFEKTFFGPLGLHSSGECSSQTDLSGYHSVEKHLEAARSSNLKLLGAAGGLCSSVVDLLKWMDALAHGKVMQMETWERMVTPTKLSDGQVLEYGFGLVIEEDSQGLEISHDGATAGFNSLLIYYPEHDLIIVLLTNTDGFDPPLRGIASSLASDLVRE
jgi:D-alanyl-D-alanine carboxypeptidase